MLYIVSTPIGNMGDITARALRILREADAIFAEDTRRTGRLLTRHDIQNRMISFFDHNKEKKAEIALEMLREGKDIALVSDSGTPGINDPAYYLVSRCAAEGINVSPVPGACAAISALVCSGLPTDRFFFHGFMPKKEGKRLEKLSEISSIRATHIFYESPHRLAKTLEALKSCLPHAKVSVARELTKKFEEIITGSEEEICERIAGRSLKGEIVLLIYPEKRE